MTELEEDLEKAKENSWTPLMSDEGVSEELPKKSPQHEFGVPVVDEWTGPENEI